MAELRTLIDYATGENWDMPLKLYEKYEKDCEQLRITVPKGLTCIQYWFTTLTVQEKESIRKR